MNIGDKVIPNMFRYKNGKPLKIYVIEQIREVKNLMREGTHKLYYVKNKGWLNSDEFMPLKKG